jgi:hypothetical protein
MAYWLDGDRYNFLEPQLYTIHYHTCPHEPSTAALGQLMIFVTAEESNGI